ncbi:MAG TPA: heme peroxidase family protein [Burkholderiales bacterium]|nr:heme peroxidase family protein [Burkholderiales bacterium]
MPNDRPKLSSAHSHGAADRGVDVPRRSPFFEGRYGRMFRSLPAAEFQDADLKKLAEQMTAEPEDKITPDTKVDDEENFGIAAGYTYLGQFIDHDLTFDPASSLQKQNDPDGLVDYRTPRFDLDSVYGRGPDDQPYLYDPDADGTRIRMALGRQLDQGVPGQPCDLPRFNECALIGDKRNDENVIVSQLHGVFLRFHNNVARALGSSDFQTTQQAVRWHYQWIVLFDFLPKIVGMKMMYDVLPHLRSRKTLLEDKPQLRLFHWENEPFIPIEFTAAVYRFGHSMVRPVYRLNKKLAPIQGEIEGLDGRKFLFSPEPNNESLSGFHSVRSDFAIDWTLFFNFDSPNAELPGGDKLPVVGLGRNRVQPAYKIDASLVNPLGSLREFAQPGEIANLAHRNLLRGARMGLPSGQAVAQFMGAPVVPEEKLKVGKATAADFESNKSISAVGPSFEGNAPLWYYVLAEAAYEWRQALDKAGDQEKDAVPVRLGSVGGRIVTEVFVGLMTGDRNSFLSQNPTWKPSSEFGAREGEGVDVFNTFTMADLIKFAQKP